MSAGDQIPLLREFMLRRIGSGGESAWLDVLVAGLERRPNRQRCSWRT